ncbi:1-acyl-sn-glycerol-3-phosphate acyltransferase, partial [Vibrio sp. 10N.222.51.A6]
TEDYDKSNVRQLANLAREQMAAKLEELDKEVVELNKK